jgi:hypothetical protein
MSQSREIFDYRGQIIGMLTLPDGTSEATWQEHLSVFRIPPPSPEPPPPPPDPQAASLAAAIAQAKDLILGKAWEDLNSTERKIIVACELSQDDIDWLLATYPPQNISP